MIKEGELAPDFTIAVAADKNFTLSAMRGKNLVLYFYPKDDTPGCTLESRDFALALDKFAKLGTIILGISKDTLKSHDKFKEKYCLPFELASDENSDVCEKYGVWVEKTLYGKKFMGIERTTLLINAEGRIVKIWNKVKVEGHVAEILDTLGKL